MSNQLMKFESPELGLSLTGTLYKGEPVFDAVEVAKALGYANPSDALSSHCKSLIKLNYSDSLESGFGNRPKGIQLAREPDFYRLVLRSQLPSAEKVQDWVCEDVLPTIRQSGSYSVSPIQPAQQEISMNNDILSLARVVAEATASATMKAVMEVSGVNLISATPAAPASPAIAVTASVSDEGDLVPINKVSWETGLSDASCRRLVTFANLPTGYIEGVRGICVKREAFISVFQVLLEDSSPPSGKRKRWQHPEFGGFELRKPFVTQEAWAGRDEQ
ncbi:BRO family protein [uncultured Erwinia sp.]|uniref:BRO-N domain-containing protein n=1 Tax=uncultured Erwinia sp. TaxID=246798 RepID=UPI002585B19C|nr:BRO family protein [uncultured Erwinia sp.]